MNELIEKLIALIDERLAQKEPAVYEIDLTKKYLIAIDHPISREQLEKMRNDFDKWAKGDATFLVIPGVNLRLVKVESDE